MFAIAQAKPIFSTFPDPVAPKTMQENVFRPTFPFLRSDFFVLITLIPLCVSPSNPRYAKKANVVLKSSKVVKLVVRVNGGPHYLKKGNFHP
jgi:hypothetical protein